ncbi:MAG TPA: GNAT family N-acetyltransferase [Vicinamibacterales bacterium]
MEKMPYRPQLDDDQRPTSESPADGARHWRTGLPVLVGSLVVLRELRAGDAPSLHEALATPEIARFISPTPTSVEGFERFIAWTHRQRHDGNYVCFAVVPRGCDTPVGLFQVRCREHGFATAEWGFAIAREFWGSGVFVDGAELVLRFTFETLGTRRLEARAALANQRGGAALCKVGAMREAVLRRSLQRGGDCLDQALWTILAEEWRGTRSFAEARFLH